MIQKSYLTLLIHIFFTFFCLTLFSQVPQKSSCATEVPENFFDIQNINKESLDYYIDEYFSKVQSKSSTAITNVPAKIHIVTDSNGGTTITESQILDEILSRRNPHKILVSMLDRGLGLSTKLCLTAV